ncbi:MAG: hypothetical protein U0361_02805 [Nitrospiraceae bacterium]
MTQLNMQLLNGAERELTDIDRDLRALEERRTYLGRSWRRPNPTRRSFPRPVNGFSIPRNDSALRAEFADKAAYYSPEHPDISKMQQEIQALERETGGAAPIDDVTKRLTGERAALATLLDRYGDDHPDVVRAACDRLARKGIEAVCGASHQSSCDKTRRIRRTSTFKRS